MSHLQYSCVIMSKIGLFHVTNTEDLFSLQTIRKWHKSQWAQTKISKDDSVTSPEASRIMSCGITVSPYDNGLPGLGIQLDSSDSVHCCTLHPIFFPTSSSFSRGSDFLKFTLYMSHVRKSITVIWRQSESQCYTPCLIIVIVVMETTELTKKC